jgi:hypothetical protein
MRREDGVITVASPLDRETVQARTFYPFARIQFRLRFSLNNSSICFFLSIQFRRLFSTTAVEASLNTTRDSVLSDYISGFFQYNSGIGFLQLQSRLISIYSSGICCLQQQFLVLSIQFIYFLSSGFSEYNSDIGFLKLQFRLL